MSHCFKTARRIGFLVVLACSGVHAGDPFCVATESEAISPPEILRDGSFGISVAIQGNRAVIGATQSFFQDPDNGAVYVFEFTDGAWTLSQTLEASDGEASDAFGTSVAMDGDTIFVGATGDDDVRLSAGAVYVFRFNHAAQRWEQNQKLTPPADDRGINNNVINNFGFSVAMSGTAAVVGVIQRGISYVYRDDGNTWSLEQRLHRTDNGGSACGCSFDMFGIQVDIDRDTIVVGDPQFGQVGSTHVFTYDGVDWDRVAKLTASDGLTEHRYGGSVAVDGATVIVSATNDDVGDTNTGSIYTFDRPGTGWADATETQKISAPDFIAHDWFGSSVSISGDLALIGQAPNAGRPGAAYVLERTTGTWSITAKLHGLGASGQDVFGLATSLDGKIGIVGAPGDDRLNPLFNAGRAYIFSGLGDCDGNGDADICDADACDPADVGCQDCNGNGTSDACDLASGTSTDDLPVGGDGIPDDCQADCNTNGIPDATDIFDGTSDDEIPVGGDGIPDECQEICGDGVINPNVGEDCDDANGKSGDGCSDSCEVESTFYCDNSTGTSVCRDANECEGEGTGHFCSPNATCTDTVGGFSCACNEGFTGFGFSCTDIDECADGGGCDVNAICENLPGSFACVCNPGYIGDGFTCEDADECSGEGGGHNCDPNAICANDTGSFTCSCDIGFIGDGVICADIDECDGEGIGNNCDPNATCNNTPGSFFCACKAGFAGDGITCADQDECAGEGGGHNCTGLAVCENTAGGFDCTCPAGYVAFQNTCIDANECIGEGSGHDCAKDETCANTPGGFRCLGPLCVTNETQALSPPDVLRDGQFGSSVAIDGRRAVVGAMQSSSSDPDNGAAYVYSFDGVSWSLDQTLTASDGGGRDLFGVSVAIASDVILVGARWDDDVRNDAGAVYVFRFNHATSLWEEDQKLVPDVDDRGSRGNRINNFGHTVALDGGVAAVGVIQRGTSYVFRDDGTAFNFEARLHRTDNGGPDCGCSFDAFGINVAIDGDTIVVGDPQFDRLGSAQVFTFDGSNWNRVAMLTASDGRADDDLGGSVAVDGDTVFVGAWNDDDGGINTGSVYVFDRPDTGWINATENSKLNAPDPIAHNWFGRSVSVSGNIALVGQAPNATRPGSAYLFRFADGAWLISAKFKGLGASSQDVFGNAVALNENIAIVGALGDDRLNPAFNAGRAYSYAGLDDCNENIQADLCDVEQCPPDDLSCQDCNGNHALDRCDIDDTTSDDVLPVKGDGIPDDCQSDCNNNLNPDLADGLVAADVDFNGRVDLRDIASFQACMGNSSDSDVCVCVFDRNDLPGVDVGDYVDVQTGLDSP